MLSVNSCFWLTNNRQGETHISRRCHECDISLLITSQLRSLPQLATNRLWYWIVCTVLDLYHSISLEWTLSSSCLLWCEYIIVSREFCIETTLMTLKPSFQYDFNTSFESKFLSKGYIRNHYFASAVEGLIHTSHHNKTLSPGPFVVLRCGCR